MTTSAKVLLTTLAVMVIGVSWTLHRPAATPPKIQTVLTKAQPMSNETKVAKREPRADRRRYRPAPVTGQVRQTVEAIQRRHQGMTQQQRSPERNLLMNRFIAALGAPGMQAKLEQRIAAITPDGRAELVNPPNSMILHPVPTLRRGRTLFPRKTTAPFRPECSIKSWGAVPPRS